MAAAVVSVAFDVVAVAALVAAAAGVLALEVVIQPLQVLFVRLALLDFQDAFAEVACVMSDVSAAALRFELAFVCKTRPRQVVPCCFALRSMSAAAAGWAAARFVPIHLLDSHVCRIHKVCSGASLWPLVVKFFWSFDVQPARQLFCEPDRLCLWPPTRGGLLVRM